jgi:hypothetical protein
MVNSLANNVPRLHRHHAHLHTLKRGIWARLFFLRARDFLAHCASSDSEARTLCADLGAGATAFQVASIAEFEGNSERRTGGNHDAMALAHCIGTFQDRECVVQ